MIGIAKKSAKLRGFMHQGAGGHRLELQKKKVGKEGLCIKGWVD